MNFLRPNFFRCWYSKEIKFSDIIKISLYTIQHFLHWNKSSLSWSDVDSHASIHKFAGCICTHKNICILFWTSFHKWFKLYRSYYILLLSCDLIFSYLHFYNPTVIIYYNWCLLFFIIFTGHSGFYFPELDHPTFCWLWVFTFGLFLE